MLKPCANISVLPGRQVRRDVPVVQRRLRGVWNQHHDDVGPSRRFRWRVDRDPGRPRFLPRAARVGQPDAHLHAAVLQVQRVRVPLRSEPDHGHLLRPDQRRDPRRRRRTSSSLVSPAAQKRRPTGVVPGGATVTRPNTKSGRRANRCHEPPRRRQPHGGRRAPSPPDRSWPSRARRTDAARRAGRRSSHGRR